MVFTDCTLKNLEALEELEVSPGFAGEVFPDTAVLDEVALELSLSAGLPVLAEAEDWVMLPETRTSSPTCLASLLVSP